MPPHIHTNSKFKIVYPFTYIYFSLSLKIEKAINMVLTQKNT